MASLMAKTLERSSLKSQVMKRNIFFPYNFYGFFLVPCPSEASQRFFGVTDSNTPSDRESLAWTLDSNPDFQIAVIQPPLVLNGKLSLNQMYVRIPLSILRPGHFV
jgi:hypothetical protein